METIEDIENVMVCIEVKGNWYQCIMPRVAKEKILDQISINGGLRVLDNPLPLKTVATHGTDELEDLQCPFIE